MDNIINSSRGKVSPLGKLSLPNYIHVPKIPFRLELPTHKHNNNEIFN